MGSNDELTALREAVAELQTRVQMLEAVTGAHGVAIEASAHADRVTNESIRVLASQTLLARTLSVASLLLLSDSAAFSVLQAADRGAAAADGNTETLSQKGLVHFHVTQAWRALQGELGAPGVGDEQRAQAAQMLANHVSWLGKPVF
jgi:hypothetical protein